MKVIDTIDKLINEIRQIRRVYNSEGISEAIIKDIEIGDNILWAFTDEIPHFSNVIFSNCKFKYSKPSNYKIVKFHIVESMKFINCDFSDVDITITQYGSRYEDYSLLFKGIKSKGQIYFQDVLKNVAIINSDIQSKVIVSNTLSDSSHLSILGSRIYIIKFGSSLEYGGEVANISDNSLLINSSTIDTLIQEKEKSRIYGLSEGGTTRNSLFGGNIENLHVYVGLALCDLSGINFSNTIFYGSTFKITKCDVAGADFSEIRYDHGSGFILHFIECEGVEDALFPENSVLKDVSDDGSSIYVTFQ